MFHFEEEIYFVEEGSGRVDIVILLSRPSAIAVSVLAESADLDAIGISVSTHHQTPPHYLTSLPPLYFITSPLLLPLHNLLLSHLSPSSACPCQFKCDLFRFL